MTGPRDPGLQPERTELAWRRTLLALAVGALVSVRVLPAVLGEWTIVSGLLGVLVAGVLWVLARRRHIRVVAVFRDRAPHATMPGAALLLAVAAFACSGAALGLAYGALTGE